MADALPLLRPDVVIHRTTGDPFSGEMLAPPWIVRSRDTNNKLMAELARRDTRQGQDSQGREVIAFSGQSAYVNGLL
jgi:radical SAM superfamily enzyme